MTRPKEDDLPHLLRVMATGEDMKAHRHDVILLAAAGEIQRGRRGGQTERVIFRYLRMPCCNHQLYWMGSRLPNFCPECGATVLSRLRAEPATTLFMDHNAVLKTKKEP